MQCQKCGMSNKKLYRHHLNYETEDCIFVCMSCHVKIHNKARKENRCPYTPTETKKLSENSATKLRNFNRFEFGMKVGQNTTVREAIILSTCGDIQVYSRFCGSTNEGSCKLPTFDIMDKAGK